MRRDAAEALSIIPHATPACVSFRHSACLDEYEPSAAHRCRRFVSRRKARVWLSQLTAKQATIFFFNEAAFSPKGWLTNRGCSGMITWSTVFDNEQSAHHFKKNNGRCHVAMINFKLSSKKIELWKNLSLTASQHIKIFLLISGQINECDFWFLEWNMSTCGRTASSVSKEFPTD